MGVIGGIIQRRSGATGYDGPSTLGTPGSWLVNFFGGGLSKAGVRVTEETALQIGTVWSAIRAISEDTAKLPLKVYRREDNDDRQVVRDHPVYRLLNQSPNPESLPIVFREFILAQAALWGNGFAEIEIDGAGRPLALWPLQACCMTLKRVSDGSLVYEYRDQGGRTPKTLPAARVFHVPGLTKDGLVGYSVVAKARETFGAALATDQFVASFWANSARPSGVLVHPKGLQETARTNLKQSIKDEFSGASNGGKIMLLYEDMKWQQMTMPLDDAQFLETRQFSKADIAAWFRIPPHKVGDLSRSTNNNIEHQGKEYVEQCLSGWMRRFEQEVWRKLFLPSEQKSMYAEHVTAALASGDLESRYRAHAIGRNGGWLSANEIRSMENMNRLPGEDGDQYLVPVNMTTPAQLEGQDPLAAPKPPAPADAPADPPSDPPAKAKKKRSEEIGSIVRAFQPGLEDALGRVLRVEIDKARRAAKKNELIAWRDAFYVDADDHVRGAVFPIVEALAGVLQAAELLTDDDWTRRTAKRIGGCHRADSLLAFTCVEAGTVAVDGILGLWEKDRAAADARAYLDEIVTSLAKEGP